MVSGAGLPAMPLLSGHPETAAHSALAAFPQWDGVKLICAQAQGMYWFLVMHKDFAARRGDVGVVKGRSIGAAPWVDIGLRRLLIEADHDYNRGSG